MTKEEIGKAIKERRKTLRKTQEDIAEINDISVRSLVNIETGKGNPSIELICDILSTLGLSIELRAKKLD